MDPLLGTSTMEFRLGLLRGGGGGGGGVVHAWCGFLFNAPIYRHNY